LRVPYERCADELHFETSAQVMNDRASCTLRPEERGRGWEGVSW
jgi:hypothetical protein